MTPICAASSGPLPEGPVAAPVHAAAAAISSRRESLAFEPGAVDDGNRDPAHPEDQAIGEGEDRMPIHVDIDNLMTSPDKGLVDRQILQSTAQAAPERN